MKYLFAIAALVISLIAQGPTPVKPIVKPMSMEIFLEAIAKVESNGNDDAIGDKGKALGRYQIQKAYWEDAVKFDTRLKVSRTWKDVVHKDYAEMVVLAYFKKYAKKEMEDLNWEMLARLHNGGPSVLKKTVKPKLWNNTTIYWMKVSEQIEKIRKGS